MQKLSKHGMLIAFPSTVQAFEKVVALNLLAAFSLTRLALPLLEATATLGNPARVINIGEVVLLGEHLLHLASLSPILPPLFLPLIPQPQGSIDGARVTLIDHFAYSSSKAALHQLSKVLAGKLGGSSSTVPFLTRGSLCPLTQIPRRLPLWMARRRCPPFIPQSRRSPTHHRKYPRSGSLCQQDDEGDPGAGAGGDRGGDGLGQNRISRGSRSGRKGGVAGREGTRC